MSTDFVDLISLSDSLLENAQNDDFAGYDPFDLLNSRLFQSLPIRENKIFRLAWLQLGKKSLVNFRPLVGVPKKRNPKGVALFILGMLEDYRRSGNERYLREASALGDWLIANCSDKTVWGGYCWGYPFDWQTRAFFVPAGKPNIIATCYAARALYGLGRQIGNNKFINASLESANFISEHLYTETDNKQFYAYIPGETAFVHNANLWGAYWCGYVGQLKSDQFMQNQSHCAARQTVNHQRADGSWLYGTRSHHNFIDSFHTGYNLEALDLLRSALKTNEFDKSIKLGYDFYLKTFFKKDGTAKYFAERVYPLDMHSVSQAIITILTLGEKSSEHDLCKRIIIQAISSLYIKKRRNFAYQRNKIFINKVNYIRWTQAWAYFAFASYNRAIGGGRKLRK